MKNTDFDSFFRGYAADRMDGKNSGGKHSRGGGHGIEWTVAIVLMLLCSLPALILG